MRPSNRASVGAALMMVVVGLVSPTPRPVEGQAALTADGLIESTEGGFKFPDGTLQTTAAASGPASLPDTGLQSCWSALGLSLPCTGTGQDGEFQFGISWPAPRFAVQGDGTILDNLTGLTWLEDANCAIKEMTWQEALDWVAAFNGGSTDCTNYSAGTFSDWRLPNVRELLSLADYGEANPTLPPGHPFINFQEQYWSSSSYEINPVLAWIVPSSFLAGTNSKTNDDPVWAVRQGG